MVLDKLFEIVNQEVDGNEILAFAKDYQKYPLKLSFSSYNEGMKFLAEYYQRIGLEAELLHFPADGRTVYADRHFPYAWDVYEAWAEIDGERIADYEESSYSVVPFSADSNGVCEKKLAVLDDVNDIKDLSDYAVLIPRFPSAADVRSLTEKGCGVFFTAADTEPIDPSLEDSRRWYNDLFGAGQMDYRDKACVGFSITPRIARELLRKLSQEEITVRYLMHTRTYEGEVCATTAVVPGDDDKCFIVSAHGYEPHATNNVAGIAMSMGAAKALTSLILSGKLPKPKHSIRFFHGLENFSLYAWGMENREKMKNALGGTSVDSFGRYGAADKTEHFVLRRCLNVHPSDQHAVAREVLKKVCDTRGIDFETREASKNNEDLMQDCEFGPAWNLLYGSLWEEPKETYPRCYFYHTNVDTADLLSPEMLSGAAVYSAVLAYYIACGDTDVERKQLAFEDWKRYTDEKCREALRLQDEDPELRGIRAQRLQTWGALASSSAAAALEVPELAKSMAAYIRDRVTASVKLIGGSLPQIKPTETGRVVIKRTMPGPVGLGTIDEALRKKAAQTLGYYSNEYWCLEECGANPYYFDGKRSVYEVAKAVWSTRAYGAHEDRNGFEKEYALYEGIANLLLEAGEAVVVEKPLVSKSMIVETLKALGIVPGDQIMVHASLKALGTIEDGAAGMVEALQASVTQKGIVAMPAFTDCTDGGTRPPFHVQNTAVESWIGAIPEQFRKTSGVVRSSHPTHSVCAWGEEAVQFLAQSDTYDCFADDGPWAKLAENGKIVFVGPTVGSNTFLHACEKWFVGYLDETIGVVDTAEGPKQVRVTNYPGGCRGGWYKLGSNAEYFKALQKKNVFTERRIGAASITVCSASVLKDAARQIFEKDPYIMLHRSGCADCARLRAKKG